MKNVGNTTEMPLFKSNVGKINKEHFSKPLSKLEIAVWLKSLKITVADGKITITDE